MFWCDTDAGFDDLLALGALVKNRCLHLVTTTSGVCENAKVGAQRVRGLLQTMACDTVDVVAGLNAPQVPNEWWLGDKRTKMQSWADANIMSGNCPEPGDTSIPAAAQTQEETQQMLQASVQNFLEQAEDSSVHIIALGPLTNIALVVSSPILAKLARDKISGFTVMGGNNVVTRSDNPWPEFNFTSDPAAAAIVFKSSLLTSMMRMVGFDICTSDDPVHHEGVDHLRQGRGLLASVVQADAWSCIADPVAAFCALYPEEVEWQALHLAIDDATGVVMVVPSGSGCPAIHVAASFPGRAKYFEWLVNSDRTETKDEVRECTREFEIVQTSCEKGMLLGV